jgi:formamidopyrimidine-DNA glycosylase
VPELPELQAHAERLTVRLSGVHLERFRALSFTALKTAAPPPTDAEGLTLDEVGRRGKYLLLRFGELTFVVHLMQGGRLRPDERQSPKPRGGLARWTFADGSALLLTEAGKEKRAGVWLVAGDPEQHEPLSRLGPDADGVSVDELGIRLRGAKGRLHGVLRDQRVIAGLGRRLANEVCHRTRLSPFALAPRLDDAAVAALYEAIVECVGEGMEFERGLDEMSSSKDRPGQVHHRGGEPCQTCGDLVRTVSYAGYEVAYCPTCQTGGKVLADNTTSKFLK